MLIGAPSGRASSLRRATCHGRLGRRQPDNARLAALAGASPGRALGRRGEALRADVLPAGPAPLRSSWRGSAGGPTWRPATSWSARASRSRRSWYRSPRASRPGSGTGPWGGSRPARSSAPGPSSVARRGSRRSPARAAASCGCPLVWSAARRARRPARPATLSGARLLGQAADPLPGCPPAAGPATTGRDARAYSGSAVCRKKVRIFSSGVPNHSASRLRKPSVP